MSGASARPQDLEAASAICHLGLDHVIRDHVIRARIC